MLNILTKNNLPEEQEIVTLVESICKRYPIPAFTDSVIVERGAVPHSHPVLTLNTRVKEPLLILDTLVHEQFHWFAQNNLRYDECIAYLRSKYSDNGECNKSGTYPNSFWEHIIVCFNTRNFHLQILTKEEVEYVYSQWTPYPLTERLIIDQWEIIQSDLELFGLMYTS